MKDGKIVKYLKVGSDIKLTSEMIDKIDDVKNYDAIVIVGQRPWTEDAMYLKESLGKEIINIPYKFKSDEEILRESKENKIRHAPSGLLAIALSMASSPEMAEMFNMDKLLRGFPNYSKSWEPKDKYLAVPKQKFSPRKLIDKRNEIKRR